MTNRLGSDRPRLVVVEGVHLTGPADPYLPLKALASYSGCSIRWLRGQLTAAHHPLPCYRLPGGKILVRRSDFDAWLAQYRRVGHPDVERIVADVLAGLHGGPAAVALDSLPQSRRTLPAPTN